MTDRQPAAPFDPWAPYYDLAHRGVAPFIAFYSGLVTADTRSLLDLGCGTGTVAIALATRLAEHTVAAGRRRRRVAGDAARGPVSTFGDRLVHGDMRSPPVDGAFDLVISTYNTLQMLLRDDDLERAFRVAGRLLSPRGLFAFDIYQPNLEWLRREASNLLARSITDDEGRRLEVREDRRYDPIARMLTTDWRLVEAGRDTDPPLLSARFEMRQYSRREIDALLPAAGLAVEGRYGDLDRSPFTAASKRQVLVCSSA